MPSDDGEPTAPHWIRRAAPSVLVSWAVTRVLVAIAYPIADAIAPHVDQPLGDVQRVKVLMYWDGEFYRQIAEQGYDGATRDVVRFFPLYPELASLFSPLFGGRADIALVFVANVTAIVAVFLLWKLVVELGYEEGVATKAVVLTSFFPAASAFAYAYSEGPFLLCLMLAALAITRRRPAWAVAPLLALGLMRPTGVLLSGVVGIAAILEFVTRTPAERREWTAWAAWVSAAVAPVVGLVAYLVYLEEKLGLGSAPLDVQSELRAGFREPVTRFLSAVRTTATGQFGDVYNLAFALVAVVAIVIAVRKRLPVVWTAYLVVGVLVANSANNIDSMGRYVLMLAPAFPLALAVVLTRRVVYSAVVGVFAVGFVWFTVVTVLGLVVP